MAWRRDHIKEMKARVQRELQFCDGSKAEFATSQAINIPMNSKPSEQLRRFIYTCQLLRYKVIDPEFKISKAETERFIVLANQLLLLNGVYPKKGRLAFLFEELFLIVSQVRLADGDVWGALWAQQKSEMMGSEPQPELVAARNIAKAIRLFRIGHATEALPLLKDAYSLSENPKRRAHACLLQGRCYKLQGQFAAAKEILNAAKELAAELGSEWAQDIAWEEASIEFFATGNLEAHHLLLKKRNDSKHWLPDYLGEWALLRFAMAPKRFRKTAYAPNTLIKKSIVSAKEYGQLYSSLKCISDIDSDAMPINDKVDRWEILLKDLNQHATIEQELMTLACCIRALNDFGMAKLAEIVKIRFQDTWAKLNSSSLDPFGIIGPENAELTKKIA